MCMSLRNGSNIRFYRRRGLKKLQETEGISHYHMQFELIRNRVKLSESYLVSAYLAGLNMVCIFNWET